jgi:hypothetical protein
MLSRWSVPEIFRVLKPNGIAIIEHIGCEDKKDFKLLFGKDSKGWRGQFLEYEKENYLQMYYARFSEFFTKVTIKNGFWNTLYTPEGLVELLQYSPTIRNFNEISDDIFVRQAIAEFSTPNGINLQQNRILIHAKNL